MLFATIVSKMLIEPANVLACTGQIHTWDRKRGYGFARRLDGSGDIFIHVKKLVPQVEVQEIPVGALVEFDVGRDPKTGRRLAVNIRLVDIAHSQWNT